MFYTLSAVWCCESKRFGCLVIVWMIKRSFFWCIFLYIWFLYSEGKTVIIYICFFKNLDMRVELSSCNLVTLKCDPDPCWKADVLALVISNPVCWITVSLEYLQLGNWQESIFCYDIIPLELPYDGFCHPLYLSFDKPSTVIQ